MNTTRSSFIERIRVSTEQFQCSTVAVWCEIRIMWFARNQSRENHKSLDSTFSIGLKPTKMQTSSLILKYHEFHSEAIKINQKKMKITDCWEIDSHTYVVNAIKSLSIERIQCTCYHLCNRPFYPSRSLMSVRPCLDYQPPNGIYHARMV